jgi:hypothetical protein
LLLEVAELFNVIGDDKLVVTIRNNIPMSYDLENFSMEFIVRLAARKIIRLYPETKKGMILIHDALTHQLLTKIVDEFKNNTCCLAISYDNLKIATNNMTKINVYDIETGSILTTLDVHDEYYISNLAFSRRILGFKWSR